LGKPFRGVKVKRLVALLCFLASTAAAYGAPLTVKEVLKACVEVKGNRLVIPVKVVSFGRTRGEVIQGLQAPQDYLKRDGFSFKRVSVTVAPVDSWSRYEVAGFSGRELLWVFVKDPTLETEVAKSLSRAREAANFTFSLGTPFWQVPEKELEAARQKVKRKALKLALKEANAVSRVLNRHCTLSSVELGKPRLTKGTVSKIELNARIKLICR
jgi:hypothetical protein